MKVDSIQSVAVIGLGTMGHGIAQTFAFAGCDVRGCDNDPLSCETAIDRMRFNLEQMAGSKLIDPAMIAPTLERITICDHEDDAVRSSDFVTEAIREDLTIKQELFRRIESKVRADTILASNTSSYPMSDISVEMQHPERAVNTHWFNPPHIIPLVEVVPGVRTSAETTQKAYDFLQHVGKMAVRLDKEIPGFLVNRIQVAIIREVLDLLDRGIASAEDIDRAVRGSAGLRLAALGPLAVMDYAGLDVYAKVYQNLVTDIRSDTQLPKPLEQAVKDGRTGAKSGAGVYDYPRDVAEERIAMRDSYYLALVQLMHRFK